MMIVTGARGLPVGQVFTPGARRVTTRVWRDAHTCHKAGGDHERRAHTRRNVSGITRVDALIHPTHGSIQQPIYVLEEVTQSQYIDWYEHETGLIVSENERRRDLNKYNHRFYRIAVD